MNGPGPAVMLPVPVPALGRLRPANRWAAVLATAHYLNATAALEFHPLTGKRMITEPEMAERVCVAAALLGSCSGVRDDNPVRWEASG